MIISKAKSELKIWRKDTHNPLAMSTVPALGPK